MYLEAVDVLREVERESLSRDMLIDYYAAYDRVYGEAGYYTQDRRNGVRYERLAQYYKDSIYLLADPHSPLYLSLRETALKDSGRLQEALALNDERLAQTPPGHPDYPFVLYGRALIYRAMEDGEQYMSCLALSAIADIQRAIKDHARCGCWPKPCCGRGFAARPPVYVFFVDRNCLYNARLRSWQSVEGLSLIDNTYQQMLKKRNGVLRYTSFASRSCHWWCCWGWSTSGGR